MSAYQSVGIVFSDSSLGGTARSALEFGRAWASIGHRVVFRPQLPIHQDKRAAFSAIGEVIDDPNSYVHTDWVHFHHGAWSSAQVKVAERLLSHAKTAAHAPRLLTHNVFGTPDDALDAWPSPRVVGVLGDWAAAQYRAARGRRGRDTRVEVVPNPQDLSRFRPPTAEERDAARARLKIEPGTRVALRVGSPHVEKWSMSYRQLFEAQPDLDFRLVGAPRALQDATGSLRNVHFTDPISDDELLQQYYWAGDTFIHLADRGESFGNVLLEALASGLSVVSLGRPFRDNTPWEFQDLPGFRLARSMRDLRASIGDPEAAPRSPRKAQGMLNRYSTGAIAEQLDAIARDRGVYRAPAPIGVANQCRVLVRHNPLVSWARAARAKSM